MCSLCGDLSGRLHWSETGTDEPNLRRRSRAQRTRYAAALLRSGGLTVREWQGSFIVSNERGRSIVVQDISACWQAAEQLAGRPIDPLAPMAATALAQAARDRTQATSPAASPNA